MTEQNKHHDTPSRAQQMVRNLCARISGHIERAPPDFADKEDHVEWGGDAYGLLEEALSALAGSPPPQTNLRASEPTIYVSRNSLDKLLNTEGLHVALQTLIHCKPLRSGNGVALYENPPAPYLRGALQKVADEIRDHKPFPAATDEYAAGYADGRSDAWLVVQEATDNMPHELLPEAVLSMEDQKAQAVRCNCAASSDHSIGHEQAHPSPSPRVEG